VSEVKLSELLTSVQTSYELKGNLARLVRVSRGEKMKQNRRAQLKKKMRSWKQKKQREGMKK